jgi:AraC-like DNA-binding protein
MDLFKLTLFLLFLAILPLHARDTIPPSGKITKPGPRTVFTANVIRIQAEAEDSGSGVAAVTFFAEYKGDKWQLLVREIGTDTARPYEVVFDCAGIPDQDMTRLNLFLEIRDRAGNVARNVDRARRKYLAIDRNPAFSESRLLSVKRRKTIRVDGDLSEWNMDPLKTAPAFPSSTSRTWIRSLWDNHNLYFGVLVWDEYLFVPDTMEKTSTGQLPLWLGDHVELSFDPLLLRKSYKEAMPELLVSALGQFNGSMGDFTAGGVPEQAWGKKIEYKTRAMGTVNDNSDTDTGFIIELKIPWSELSIKPRHKKEIGFDAFNRDFVDRESEPLFSSLSGVQVQQNDNPSEWAVLELRNPLFSSYIKGLIICLILLVPAIIVFLRLYGRKSAAQQAVPASAVSKIVEQTNAFIASRYGDPGLKLSVLAKQAGLSERYFSRLYKRHTGTAPVDYLNQFRVEKAKIMLKDPSRNISEIALEVGFGTVSNFNIVFKKATGKTPTGFRAGF